MRDSQQAQYQKGFGFEIVEEPRLYQYVTASQQLQGPFFFGAQPWYLDDQVPSPFHGQQAGSAVNLLGRKL
jgi:hypothetical protein